MKFSSSPNTGVQQVPQWPYFKISAPLFHYPLFFRRTSQPTSQDQENGYLT